MLCLVISLCVPSAVYMKRVRAYKRLELIVANLKRIDSATTEFCMEGLPAPGPIDKGTLVPTFLVWPKGPVPGAYTITTCGTTDTTISPFPATFNGGNRGPLTWSEWQGYCGDDPESCGL